MSAAAGASGTNGGPAGANGRSPHTDGGPPATHPERYKWIALSNTTLGVLMAVINQSIVIIALPAIFRGIHLNPLIPSNTSYLLWMLLSFMVVMAVLVVSLGRVGDIFGRVRMYNLGFAVFTLGSILLSVTWLQGSAGAMWMIVMRVVQGIGAAFLMANSSAILTDAFPAEERGLALGINMVAAIAGSFIGLVLGGVLAPVAWRLVFLVSVPFGLFGTVWAYLKLEERGIRSPAKIDWWGNITFAVGLIAVLVGITYGILPYGGHNMGWTAPGVIGALVGGILVLCLFVVIERRVAAPMFRLDLFKIRAFSGGSVATFLAALARGGLMFMLILWLQGIWLPLHGYSFKDTPLWAGIYMLPLSVGFLIAGPISGRLADRFGARPFATGGHDRVGDRLPAPRRDPDQLQLLGVRGRDPADRRGDGHVRRAEPDRDHEQPAAQPAGVGRRHGCDVPELRVGAVDRGVLQPDHRRPVIDAARCAVPRPGVARRSARRRLAGLEAAARREPVRVVPRVQPGRHAARYDTPAPAPGNGHVPDRAQVLSFARLPPVRERDPHRVLLRRGLLPGGGGCLVDARGQVLLPGRARPG